MDVAVDANYIYWTTAGVSPTVRRKATSSDASDGEYFTAGTTTLYLAVGEAGLAYVTGSDIVTRGPHPNAGYGDLIYRAPGATGVAVDGVDLYWGHSSSISQGSIDGMKPAQPILTGTSERVSGVATSGGSIYWVSEGTVIKRKSLTSPMAAQPREVCRGLPDLDAGSDAGPGAVDTDIAVDEAWVYFTEPNKSQISKCRKP